MGPLELVRPKLVELGPGGADWALAPPHLPDTKFRSDIAWRWRVFVALHWNGMACT